MAHRDIGFQLKTISYLGKIPIQYCIYRIIYVRSQDPNLGSGEAKGTL